MKEILQLIQQKKQEFATLSFFRFVQDETIPPEERLFFYPCLAAFALNFRDLNRYDFLDETSNDKLQQIINIHTYEDATHWEWFLHDFELLGFDTTMKFSEVMRFIWSDELVHTRRLCHNLAMLSYGLEPVLKMVVIETMETIGLVVFEAFAKPGEQIAEATSQKYQYLSNSHILVETGHAVGTENVVAVLEQAELTSEQRKKAIEIVNCVFAWCTESMKEFERYANKHRGKKAQPISRNQSKLLSYA